MRAIEKEVWAFCGRGFQGNSHIVCIIDSCNDHVLTPSDLHTWVLEKSKGIWPKILVLVAGSKQGEYYNLRCFKGESEIEFCGSGAISAARVLFDMFSSDKWRIALTSKKYLPRVTESNSITLRLKSRTVVAKKDKNDICIAIEFIPSLLKQGDGSTYSWYKNIIGAEIKHLSQYGSYCIAELDGMGVSDKKAIFRLKRLRPRLLYLARIGGPALIVTIGLSQAYDHDYAMRYFAPQFGNPEDAATGSANGLLMFYWSQRCLKTKLSGVQCSREGGEFSAKVSRKQSKVCVGLSGKTSIMAGVAPD